MDKMNELYNYIVENFNVPGRLIYNICRWVFLQSMDKEDSIETLMQLLDGIGIEREEIAPFITW